MILDYAGLIDVHTQKYYDYHADTLPVPGEGSFFPGS